VTGVTSFGYRPAMSEQQGPGKHAARADEPTDDATPQGEETDEASGGTRQPGADPEDEQAIEEEREQRLDPENRPDNVEVDNTDRDFDPEKGMFTDSEGYDEADPKFPATGEQGA